MARYAIDGVSSNGGATPTIISLGNSGVAPTVRARVYDLIIGCKDTPGDQAAAYFMGRYTAAGTSTAIVPTALDEGDLAAAIEAGENHTGEPSYASAEILLRIDLNQRATFRWVAAPGGELVIPAIVNEGLGIYGDPTTAYNAGITIHFEE
jgi:hypothetical protein